MFELYNHNPFPRIKHPPETMVDVGDDRTIYLGQYNRGVYFNQTLVQSGAFCPRAGPTVRHVFTYVSV